MTKLSILSRLRTNATHGKIQDSGPEAAICENAQCGFNLKTGASIEKLCSKLPPFRGVIYHGSGVVSGVLYAVEGATDGRSG